MFNIKSRFIYAIMCYILAVIIIFSVIPLIISKTYGKINAVYVIEPVSKGKQFTEDNLKEVLIGDLNLPKNLISKKEDVIGCYAAVDIVSNDQLTFSKISQIPLDKEIPEGSTAINLTVKMIESSNMAGNIQAGDVIRLYHYKDKLIDIPELQFVEVISVLHEEQEKIIITVLAVEKQAEKIKEMKKEGIIYVSFISRDNKLFESKLLKQQQENLNK